MTDPTKIDRRAAFLKESREHWAKVGEDELNGIIPYTEVTSYTGVRGERPVQPLISPGLKQKT